MRVKLYPFYSHRVDPAMVALTAVIERNGPRAETAKKAGVGTGTLGNWCKRKTRRPQFMTLVAVARGIGPEGIDALVSTIRRGK